MDSADVGKQKLPLASRMLSQNQAKFMPQMISESTERGKIDDIKTRLVVVKNNFIDVIMQMNKKTETLESIGSEEPMEMSGVRDLRDLTP